MKSLEDRLHDGSRAKEIIENEQFNASFDAIEKEVIETWKSSPARDHIAREKCYDYLKLLQKVKMHLVSTMETGKLAEIDLSYKQGLKDRLMGGFSSRNA